MSAPRLPVAPADLRAGAYRVAGADHHYLFRVLRLRPAAALVLFDGAGREAAAVVETIAGDHAVLRVAEPAAVAAAPASRPRLVMLPALIKGDRMEWCVEKLVEVGADEIIPVATRRAVVKLDGERAARRRARLEAIATAAARQCGRATIPPVRAPVPLTEALAAVADAECKLLVWEGARDRSLAGALGAGPWRTVATLTGPEGGLSDEEVAEAQDAGFVPVGLGPRTLRAETAAVIAAALVASALGDFG